MPHDPKEDQDLVASCLANDPRAWNAFVERFAKLIHWSIRKTLAATTFSGRDDLAAEVFQDFFKRLLEKGELTKLREVSSVRKFLSVAAAHLTLDRIKSFSRREKRFVLPDEDNETLFDAPAAPPALSTEERALIERSLAGLTKKERACIEACYLEGLTHRAIAERLDIPQDTVSTIIRRTLEKLRKDLEERGF